MPIATKKKPVRKSALIFPRSRAGLCCALRLIRLRQDLTCSSPCRVRARVFELVGYAAPVVDGNESLARRKAANRNIERTDPNGAKLSSEEE